MELKGTLSEGALPGLLKDIYVARRTGLLHLRQGSGRGSILFVQGNIVHGATNIKECRLGESLVRHALLSQSDLDQATEAVILTKNRLGQVLVEMGILDQKGLEEALALHVREILLCVFSWSEGSYEFEEQEAGALQPYGEPLRLSTGEVILDAVWSVTDPDVVRYALGDIDRVLMLTADPLLRFQRVTLTPTDGFILSRVDGILTAREILAIAPVSREEAQRSLFGLLCTGMVECLPKPAKKEVSTLPAREEVLDAYRGLSTRDHFEVLGITAEATEAEVKEAYFRLARRFHPDNHHDPSLGDLRDELEAVFNRIGAAYKVLSDPQRRAEYESGLAVARLAPGPEPELEAGAPAPGPHPPAPILDPEQVREILERIEGTFSEGKYWDVIKALEEEILPVAKGRLRQRARVLLAQCYLKNPRWKKMGEEELQAAIQEDRANAEAHFLLGKLYKEGRLTGRAASMFRRTLELKPRHAGALEELASLAPEAPSDTPGLIKKLFK